LELNIQFESAFIALAAGQLWAARNAGNYCSIFDSKHAHVLYRALS